MSSLPGPSHLPVPSYLLLQDPVLSQRLCYLLPLRPQGPNHPVKKFMSGQWFAYYCGLSSCCQSIDYINKKKYTNALQIFKIYWVYKVPLSFVIFLFEWVCESSSRLCFFSWTLVLHQNPTVGIYFVVIQLIHIIYECILSISYIAMILYYFHKSLLEKFYSDNIWILLI